MSPPYYLFVSVFFYLFRMLLCFSLVVFYLSFCGLIFVSLASCCVSPDGSYLFSIALYNQKDRIYSWNHNAQSHTFLFLFFSFFCPYTIIYIPAVPLLRDGKLASPINDMIHLLFVDDIILFLCARKIHFSRVHFFPFYAYCLCQSPRLS